jgi:phosphatidylinositol-4-phosphate 3-kinase
MMLTKRGFFFHIDYGKFLGDAQKFGSIKRDRVPFVLTADMAYVINGGESQSPRFQVRIPV